MFRLLTPSLYFDPHFLSVIFLLLPRSSFGLEARRNKKIEIVVRLKSKSIEFQKLAVLFTRFCGLYALLFRFAWQLLKQGRINHVRIKTF